jgi:hypothetical protein
MHTTEYPQIRPQSRPHAFAGIGVRFARPVAIRVARPFSRAVTHRRVRALNRGIAVIFIGVDMCARPSELLDMCAQRRLLRVQYDPQPHLAADPTHRPEYWRSVIGIGTAPTTLIRSRAWWIERVEMLVTFFSGVLEQFIAFSCTVRKRRGRLNRLDLGLEAMPPF